MKRYIALFLALMLSASTLACGGDSGSGSDTTTASADTTTAAPESTRLDELGERDLSGKTFMILDANDHPTMHINMPEEEANGDIVNDALIERDTFIEERYGVDIKYEQITGGDKGRAALKNCIAAGDDTYQLIITPVLGTSSLATMATTGELANLADIEHISLDKPWWSHLIYESLKLNDKMYFTTGDISPTMYMMPAAYYLNTSLAEDYGYTSADVCDAVRAGKWTHDYVYEMVKDLDRDVNDDGVMSTTDDFFGYIDGGIGGLTTYGLVSSCGVKLAELSDDGKDIILDYDNEYTVNVIEKLRNFYNPTFKLEGFNEYISKTFKEGRALVLYHYLESAKAYLRDMDDDYLVLPMPKYDEDQESYISFCNSWADAFIAIPTTADLDFVGFVTEAMGYYSYENVRPLAYDMTYTQKITRDDNSAEMLNIIFDTLYIDFNHIYEFGNSATVLTNAIKGSALSTEMAKTKEAGLAKVEELVENWG